VADHALESIEIEGYLSIRSARVELGALNVLVGANGAGKSNFVRAFEFLGDPAQRVEQLGDLYDDPEPAERLVVDSVEAGGPELVNDGPETAPSKRLARYRPGYVKTLDGPSVIAALGLPELRSRCPHLDRWLTRLGGD
jgi:energy-coupling factor transporter ATP-binding protein EcfA2